MLIAIIGIGLIILFLFFFVSNIIKDIVEIENDLKDIRKDITNVANRINRIKRKLFVTDYFADCPCCGLDDLIVRSEAKSFRKVGSYQYEGISQYYTTEQGYEAHKNQIEQWEKEVEEMIKHNKNKNE